VNIPCSNVVEKNVYRLGLDNLQNVLFNFNGIKISVQYIRWPAGANVTFAEIVHFSKWMD
jgi:hypothetical protein